MKTTYPNIYRRVFILLIHPFRSQKSLGDTVSILMNTTLPNIFRKHIDMSEASAPSLKYLVHNCLSVSQKKTDMVSKIFTRPRNPCQSQNISVSTKIPIRSSKISRQCTTWWNFSYILASVLKHITKRLSYCAAGV